MSELYQTVSHSKWDCKYHAIFVPKRRRKAIFGQARRQLGAIFHALAGKRNAGLSRVIRCRIMCICASPFPQNTHWHR